MGITLSEIGITCRLGCNQCSCEATDQEINEAVARRMGWTQPGSDWGEDNWEWATDNELKPWLSPNKENWVRLVPDFCHSLPLAWKIVDKIEEEAGTFRYQTMKNGVRGHFVTIGYLSSPVMSYHEHVEAEGESAAMAICLAFLKIKKGI